MHLALGSDLFAAVLKIQEILLLSLFLPPIRMIAVCFIYLLYHIASFVLEKTGTKLPFDPAWVTVIICGIPLLYLSVWRIIHNKGISKISSALLITVAMIAAICIGDLFAAGEVAFIMEIGAILEDMTTERAKKGLKKLISLTPTQGRLIRDGKEVSVSSLHNAHVVVFSCP